MESQNYSRRAPIILGEHQSFASRHAPVSDKAHMIHGRTHASPSTSCLPARLHACTPARPRIPIHMHARVQSRQRRAHGQTIRLQCRAPAMARTTRMSSSSPSVDSSSCTSTCHPCQTHLEESTRAHACVSARHAVKVYGVGHRVQDVGCTVQDVGCRAQGVCVRARDIL